MNNYKIICEAFDNKKVLREDTAEAIGVGVGGAAGHGLSKSLNPIGRWLQKKEIQKKLIKKYGPELGKKKYLKLMASALKGASETGQTL